MSLFPPQAISCAAPPVKPAVARGAGKAQNGRMTEHLIRRAGRGDARTLAEIHIQTWRETYAGIMPEEILAGLDVDKWTQTWRDAFAGADDPAFAVFLAHDLGGAPSGFLTCRRQTSQKLLPLGYDGEITHLYLLRRLHRQGVGRRLSQIAARRLLDKGCAAAALWVLRDNPPARRFYEALGAAPTGVAGVWEIYGAVLPDIAYGWRDLRQLEACCVDAN